MSWTLVEIQLATFTIRHLNNPHYFSDERWNLGLCSIVEEQRCGLSDVLLTLKFTARWSRSAAVLSHQGPAGLSCVCYTLLCWLQRLLGPFFCKSQNFTQHLLTSSHQPERCFLF